MVSGAYIETIVFILFIQLFKKISVTTAFRILRTEKSDETNVKPRDNSKKLQTTTEHPAKVYGVVLLETIRYRKINVMGAFFSSMSH